MRRLYFPSSLLRSTAVWVLLLQLLSEVFKWQVLCLFGLLSSFYVGLWAVLFYVLHFLYVACLLPVVLFAKIYWTELCDGSKESNLNSNFSPAADWVHHNLERQRKLELTLTPLRSAREASAKLFTAPSSSFMTWGETGVDSLLRTCSVSCKSMLKFDVSVRWKETLEHLPRHGTTASGLERLLNAGSCWEALRPSVCGVDEEDEEEETLLSL